jgi:type II secretory pathway pseudopilin PulG
MRFQTTVVPAQRDCDVSKTGLACFLTKPKSPLFGNGTFWRSPRLTGESPANRNVGDTAASRPWHGGVRPNITEAKSRGGRSSVLRTAHWLRPREIHLGLAGAHPSRRQSQGFTLIELLTLVGAMGILFTLGISTVTSIRTSSRQVTCIGNLETIAAAINRYAEETGHRPRSLSRLTEHQLGIDLSLRLICPSDPAVRGSGRTRELRDLTWGNRANESQDPGIPSVVGEPESGSWQTELQERKETLPFSYLHPLGWTRSAWDRLRAQGPPFGTAVCQLHGVRVPAAPGNPDHRTYMEYEGRFLRAQTDGSVVRRKLFRDPDPQPGLVTTASPAPLDYPWEFYTDRNVPKLK